jgi:hypothetical protein
MTESSKLPIDPMADQIHQLADEIFRDKVLRARQTSARQKFLDGLQLFDWACRQTLNGIRNRYPNSGPDEHLRILRRRLANARKMDEAGIYSPPQDDT